MTAPLLAKEPSPLCSLRGPRPGAPTHTQPGCQLLGYNENCNLKENQHSVPEVQSPSSQVAKSAWETTGMLLGKHYGTALRCQVVNT